MIKVSNVKKQVGLSFFWGGIVGAVVYVALFGVSLLDVTYVDWLYSPETGGDISIFQLLWEFFRNDPWQFPIGYISNFLYGVGESGSGLIYHDIAPLGAVFFKLLRGILPAQFQYLGLWQLFSFIMLGGLSSSILIKYLKKLILTLCLIPLFLVTSFVLWRSFHHIALCGTWVYVVPVFIWVYKDELFNKTWKQLAAWVIATSLAMWVHTYFIIPVGIAMVGFLLEDWLINRKTGKALCIFFSCVAGVLFSFWLLGGFVLLGSSSSAGGPGHYSTNLLSWFDSDGYSSIFPDIPSTSGNYEGWNYLGLSGMALFFVALLITVYRGALEDAWIEKAKKNWKTIVSIAFVLVAVAVIALSPIVFFADKKVLDYSWFKLYYKLLGAFRCTGRTSWFCTYIVMFFSVITVFKRIRKNEWAVVLALLLVVGQMYDLGPLISQRSDRARMELEYTSPLESDFWDDAAEQTQHVYRLSYSHWGYPQEFPLDFYATANNMTLNNGYLSRNNDAENLENIAQGIKAVMTDDLDEDTLYCIEEDKAFTEACMTGDDVVELHVDGYYVYIHKDIWDQLDQEKYQDIYMENTGEYLTARSAYLAENAGV